jgi:hypothetical protein
MLITIDSSIADSLEQNPSATNPCAIAIDYLADTARHGNHILFGEIGVLDRIIGHSDCLSDRTRIVLNKIRSQTPFKGDLIDAVCLQAIVESTLEAPAIETVNGKKQIRIPAKLISEKPSLVDKARFLTENLNDGIFYKNLALSFIQLDPDLREVFAPLKINYSPLNGGGNTTADVYHELTESQDYLCLCITDSDKKCPTSGYGDTARRLVEYASNPPEKWNCELFVIDVRTIENLAPISELQFACAQLDDTQLNAINKLLAKFWSTPQWRYLPIKKGIRCHDLNSGNLEHQIYWREQLGVTECTSNDSAPCNSREKCTHTVFASISDQLLSKLVGREQGQLVISSIHDSSLIPDIQIISRQIASFFCAERVSLDLQD